MNDNKHINMGLRHFIKVPLILLCLVLQFNNTLHAQNLYTNASGGAVTAPNTAVSIATALTVGTVTTPTPLTAATVSISGNFVTGEDVLKINEATSGTDGSITFSYNATSGVMTLTGAATEAQYETTLRKITYTNTAASPNTAVRTVSFSLNAALPYSVNGHYYEYITSDQISWSAAQSAAALKTYFGLQGYLVTVTSSGESAFVSSKLNGAAGWLGASDAALEGAWKWVTGPETGTQFWGGAGSAAGGAAVGGQYTNWNGTAEPNNSSDEDYGQFVVTTGMWNDLTGASSTAVNGYVVEYGGMTGDPTIHISDVVSVNVVYNPTSITATATTICNGYRTTLTAVGAMGTVYWYTGSCGGTEIGTGNSITVSPTTTTTYYARNNNGTYYSNGCASIEITVNQPSFTPGTFTVANLQATGTDIKWYTTPVGGTPMASIDAISNGAKYYASQTVNSVESTTRLEVTANIDATPCAPTATSPQTLGASAKVSALTTLTGQNIRWYTTSTGGEYLDANTSLVSGTYYASQTVNCTESAERLAVTVTIN
jgi:hypothetical protein